MQISLRDLIDLWLIKATNLWSICKDPKIAEDISRILEIEDTEERDRLLKEKNISRAVKWLIDKSLLEYFYELFNTLLKKDHFKKILDDFVDIKVEWVQSTIDSLSILIEKFLLTLLYKIVGEINNHTSGLWELWRLIEIRKAQEKITVDLMEEELMWVSSYERVFKIEWLQKYLNSLFTTISLIIIIVKRLIEKFIEWNNECESARIREAFGNSKKTFSFLANSNLINQVLWKIVLWISNWILTWENNFIIYNKDSNTFNLNIEKGGIIEKEEELRNRLSWKVVNWCPMLTVKRTTSWETNNGVQDFLMLVLNLYLMLLENKKIFKA